MDDGDNIVVARPGHRKRSHHIWTHEQGVCLFLLSHEFQHLNISARAKVFNKIFETKLATCNIPYPGLSDLSGVLEKQGYRNRGAISVERRLLSSRHGERAYNARNIARPYCKCLVVGRNARCLGRTDRGGTFRGSHCIFHTIRAEPHRDPVS
jgi:hypothetical protein